MPQLLQLLNSSDWLELESGILILGAIAEGLFTNDYTYDISEFEKNLPSLIENMIQFGLNHEKALIRSITCWTLSRYSHWIISNTIQSYGWQDIEEARATLFKPLVYSLLDRILDHNKRVQESACSAFATLEEEATSELNNYLDDIVNTLIKALQQYQTKNLLILYDAIGTLADYVSEPLASAKNIEQLLKELMLKWETMPTDLNDPRSLDVFQLLECLIAISTAIGGRFVEYSKNIFLKSVSMIKSCLDYNSQYLEQQNQLNKMKEASGDGKFEVSVGLTLIDPPNKDYMVVGLDLLSGVTEGLGSDVGNFVKLSEDPTNGLGISVIDIMLSCTTDAQAEVRQSAFAFMGDLTKSCYSFVHPRLQDIIPIINRHIVQFTSSSVSVCNNATWALGEICVNLHKMALKSKNLNLGEIENHDYNFGQNNGPNKNDNQFVPEILKNEIRTVMQYLCQINDIPDMEKTLLENTSITIGRLGLLCPLECSDFISDFIKNWCNSLKGILENDEKYTSFLGLVFMLYYNPNILINDSDNLVLFCMAVVSWNSPPNDLYSYFQNILNNVVSNLESNRWNTIKNMYMQPIVAERLRLYYKI